MGGVCINSDPSWIQEVRVPCTTLNFHCAVEEVISSIWGLSCFTTGAEGDPFSVVRVSGLERGIWPKAMVWPALAQFVEAWRVKFSSR
jgi:hypothetical protein